MPIGISWSGTPTAAQRRYEQVMSEIVELGAMAGRQRQCGVSQQDSSVYREAER